MAKASFYINHIKVREEENYLVLEARKQCHHGTVFDEVLLTPPVELAHLFTDIDSDSQQQEENELASSLNQFKHFNWNN